MKQGRTAKATILLTPEEKTRMRWLAQLRGCVFSKRSRRAVNGNISAYLRMLVEQDYAKYQVEGGYDGPN